MFKILALGALAMFIKANAKNADWTWNEVVGADLQLFPSEVASIRTHVPLSDTNGPLLNELSGLLGQDEVLNAVYNKYLIDYKKELSRSLFSTRQEMFKKSLMKIAAHNLDASKGKYSWTQGVNNFADMSDEEYLSYLTYNGSLSQFYGKAGIPEFGFKNSSSTLANNYRTISWRGKLTPVKDQGQCGSCYAFAAVGQLEAHHIINGGTEYDLSEQQVVDCSRSYGNAGCQGGSLEATAEYLKNGVALERDYPYTGIDGECNSNANPAEPKILHYEATSNDAGVKTGLLTGPVVIAVSASCQGFEFYRSGILRECEFNRLNHAVLAFGYNADEGYYEVKNSWGMNWGDNGFIKIGEHVAGIGRDNVAIWAN